MLLRGFWILVWWQSFYRLSHFRRCDICEKMLEKRGVVLLFANVSFFPMHFRAFAISVFIFFAAFSWSRADVALPALISDNMVLQQRAKANVWGTADKGEKITVKLGEKTVSTTAGDDGKWSVKLDALKAGGPLNMIIRGRNTIVVKNVAVGEVWLCAGASNMGWKVANSENAEQEIAAANFPMIRVFTVEQKVSGEAEDDCHGKWEVCDPQTVAGFSATAYFFGRELHQKLKAPVGLIQVTSNATSAEAWMSPSAFGSDADLKAIPENWQSEMKNYPAAKAAYDEQMTAWNAEAEKAKSAGQPAPKKPIEPRGADNPAAPSGLFNGMIAPVSFYSIKGVAWYQGEANTGNPKLYVKLFPALISGWRSAWSVTDLSARGAQVLPFLFVQIASFMPRQTEPGESNWASLREAQTAALKLPKTGMAVAIDLGGEREMHPKNKQEIGRRLALIAEASVYGKEDVASSGPVFSSMKTSDNKVTLSFKQVNGGLVDKDGPPLKGFAIAGEDKKFVWADAKIAGDKVVVQSEAVPHPVAVRYAWAGTPDCDLRNKAGLPAAPFRTDNW